MSNITSTDKNKPEKFYDIPALREQIKLLKNKQADLQSESASIQQDIYELESKSVSLRSELNVLGAVDHVRIHENPNQIESDSDNVILDKKFIEANAKLEMKILISDIRSTLPTLEAEAIRWEEEIHNSSVVLKNEQVEYAKLPPNFTMTIDQINEEIIKLTKEKAKIKGI